MRKIVASLICLTLLAFSLTGCFDKGPPPLGERAADLSKDVVDGQWDVWLEVWKTGDRSNVYKARLRFNIFTPNSGVCGFSIETKQADRQPDRFADLPGFHPDDVYALGFVSAAGRDVIYVWSEEFPEHTFRIQLTKNNDGFLTGYGELSYVGKGGTSASLQIRQVT